MARNYRKHEDGEWILPVRRGYRLACCDCGLVHTVDFKLIKTGRTHHIAFRFTRNHRSTAAMRRHPQYCTPDYIHEEEV